MNNEYKFVGSTNFASHDLEDYADNIKQKGLMNNLASQFIINEFICKNNILSSQASKREQNAYILKNLGGK